MHIDMLWVIPIGGRGLRTKQLGEFKPFINIKGRKMLSWLLISIRNNISPGDQFIFTATSEQAAKYAVVEEISRLFESHQLANGFKLFLSRETLLGPAPSIYLAKEILNTSEPVAVLNCDQYTDFELPEVEPKTGYLSLELDFGDKKGYVEIKEGLIKRFVEKEHISDYASNGVFIAGSGGDLMAAFEKMFKDKKVSVSGEYHVGPAFNYLIGDGYQVYPLLTRVHYSLGSLEAIKYFAQTPLAEGLAKL
jgi:NDP-sugar pyrophosphorylase family protein